MSGPYLVDGDFHILSPMMQLLSHSFCFSVRLFIYLFSCEGFELKQFVYDDKAVCAFLSKVIGLIDLQRFHVRCR